MSEELLGASELVWRDRLVEAVGVDPSRMPESARSALTSLARLGSGICDRLVELIEGWRSWLLPISVDGLVLVGSMSALARRRTGQPADRLTSVAMALGLVASFGVNVIANDPGLLDPAWVKRLVGAWSPLALAITYELFLRLRAGASRAA